MMATHPFAVNSYFDCLQDCSSAMQEFLQEVQASAEVEYGQLADILVRQAQSADEVTRITALRWLRAFVVQGKEQLLPFYAVILAAVLPNVSHSSQDICQVSTTAVVQLL